MQLAGRCRCRPKHSSVHSILCYLLHVLHCRCCRSCLLVVGRVGGVWRHCLLLGAMSLRQLVLPLALCRHHVCHRCQQSLWQLLLLNMLLRRGCLCGLRHRGVGGVGSS